MLGERVVIIVNSMLMNYSVCMPMADNMAMRQTVRMTKDEAEIVMAGISCRRFRGGDKHALQSNSRCCHHHDDDGDASGQRLSSQAQIAASGDQFRATIG
jgi:hypothetical protein